MGKAVISLILYIGMLFLITFLLPVNSEQINTDIQDINVSEISSSAWDIKDNVVLFLSFFSFSMINPLGMPTEIMFIISLINVIISIILLYAVIVLGRGGGDI